MSRMKRLISLMLVAGFIAALPATHSMAGPPKKKKKVKICHVTPANAKSRCGHVISVSRNALQAHLDHGDSQRFSLIKKGKKCKGAKGNVNCIIGGIIKK